VEQRQALHRILTKAVQLFDTSVRE